MLISIISCQKNTSITYFENEINNTLLKPVNINFISFLMERIEFFYKSELSENVINELKKKLKQDLNINKINFNSVGLPIDAHYFRFLTFSGYSYYRKLISNNYVKDITQMFPKYAPEYYKKLSKEMLNQVSVENKIYAIPSCYNQLNRLCAVIRNDLIKKYKIKEMDTFNNLDAFCKLIRKNEKDILPLNLFNLSLIKIFAEAFGYVIFDEKLGLVYRIDDPDINIVAWESTNAFDESIETLSNWFYNEYIGNESIYTFNQSALLEGKVGVIILPVGEFEVLNSYISVYSELPYRFVEYPLYKQQLSTMKSSLNGALLIDYRSLNPERVLMFIEWVHLKQENYDLLMYGINNENFTIYDNNYDLSKNKIDIPIIRNWYGSNAFRDIDLDRLEISSPNDYKENILELSNKSIYPPHMGFIPDYNSIIGIELKRENAYSALESAINSGNFSPKVLEQFNKKINEDETENLLSVIQTQLNEWKNN